MRLQTPMYYADIDFDSVTKEFVATVEGIGATRGLHAVDVLAAAEKMTINVLQEIVFRGEKLPTTTRTDGTPVLMSATTQIKLVLYCRMIALGLSKADLAKKLKAPPSRITRLFNLHHTTTLAALIKAGDALDCKIQIWIKST